MIKTTTWVLLGAAMFAVAEGAHAQAFAEREEAKVDYADANLTPAKVCGIAAEAAPTARIASGAAPTNGNALRAPSADVIEIGATAVPAAGDVPAHCRVAGVIAPAIAFEVTLPDRWNGRFYMIGNGGHAGEALDNPGRVAQKNAALAVGFAFAQTNTGHYASEEPGASFVLSDPQKAIDYAYRAVHMTATTAKAITADYYGRPVSYAYWNSCSNGGRQGLIEAQRYPEDFDGVIANAPWVDQTGFTVGAIWNQRALTEAPLTAGKMALVAERVMATCDAVDGLEDGLIDDPRNCDFDPVRDVPSCSAATDIDQCLTRAQAESVAKVYGGPISNGKQYFPGFMPGSEAVTTGLFGGGTGSGWMNVIVPREPGANAADFGLADNTMKYLVHVPPNPEWDFREFDFDRHDAVTAIIDWVEADEAPDSIVASKVVDGNVVRSRPLCPYPEVARHTGRGSIDDAASFRCESP